MERRQEDDAFGRIGKDKIWTEGGEKMFRQMRRIRQALSEEENAAVLQRNTAGVLSLLDENGYTYGVPLSYALCGNTIYFHGSKKGAKMDAVGRHAQVSFTVIDQDKVLWGEFNTLYRSVIAFGRAVKKAVADLLSRDKKIEYSTLSW